MKGYQFNRVKNVFNDFVTNIMHIKQNPRSDTEKSLAKLILNSLIGRFGMDVSKSATIIHSAEEHLKLLYTKPVKNTIKITEDLYLDIYEDLIDESICKTHNKDYIETLNENKITEGVVNSANNVSITTAAAVLAYARIHMAKAMLDILRAGGKLYYTDTDSIITDIDLPPTKEGENRLHDSELGKFKLEHLIKDGKGLFIADKTYVFISDKIDPDTKENKIVKRAKAVKSSSLTYESYEKMYNKEVVQAIKISGVRNYGEGYVSIHTDKVSLNPTNYRKRLRIVKNGKWVDTAICHRSE
jgi:hypothetical protein